MKMVNGKEVLEDGETIKRGLVMMDGKPVVPQLHKPGFATQKVTDAGHYNAYESRVQNAWKNPPALPPASQPNTAASAGDADAYAKYDRRVSEAWRGNAAEQIKKEQAAHAKGLRAANV